MTLPRSTYSSEGACIPLRLPVNGKLPVRMRPRVCEDQDLEEVNRTRGAQERFLTAVEEMRALEEVLEREPSREEVERWATHPDERVRLCLLEQEWFQEGEYGEIAAYLYNECWREAEETGVLWSPVLDSLESNDCWPQYLEYRLKGKEYKAKVRGAAAHLMDLIPHFKACSDLVHWEEVGSAFKSREMRLAAASSVHPLLPEPLRSLWFSGPESWSRYLGQEKPVTEDERLWLMERASDALCTKGDWSSVSCAVDVLVRLSEDAPLPPSGREGLMQLLRRCTGKKLNPFWGMSTNGALHALCASPDLAEGEMECALAFAQGRPADIKSLTLGVVIASPSATPEIWREILKVRGKLRKEVFVEIARHEPARRDPVVRAKLRRSGVEKILLLLARDAEEDLGEILSSLGSLSPSVLEMVLGRLTPEQVALLKRSDMVPLLGSPDPSARVAALRLVGRLAEEVRESTHTHSAPKKSRSGR